MRTSQKNEVRYTHKYDSERVNLDQKLVFKRKKELSEYEKNSNSSMVLDNATDAWLFLLVDKKIVGAIEYGINGSWINIANLRVDEQYQRLGYATQLMLFVLNQVEKDLDLVTLCPRVSGKGCPQKELEQFYSRFTYGKCSKLHIEFENI